MKKVIYRITIVCLGILVAFVVAFAFLTLDRFQQGLIQKDDAIIVNLALMCLLLTIGISASCLGIRRDVREIRDQLKQMKSLNDEEDNQA